MRGGLTHTPAMESGTVLAGRYTIEVLAGRGGMGAVYRACDRDGKAVAIKVLDASVAGGDQRFQREARLLCSLEHPAVVRYLDSGSTAEGQRYLVMEWLDGQDLRAVLRVRRLGLGDSLQLARRVAMALGVAHASGIVHRDVKPANVFLPDGNVALAKLLDFGLARWIGSVQAFTSAGTRFGTPAYMSPEQVRGEHDIDSRCDVFSLGCVLYECLTGEPAFAASNAMAVFCKILLEKGPYARDEAPWVPEEVEALLQRMLAKEPGERPRDGYAVATEIAGCVASLPELDVTPPSAPRSRRAITESEQRWANVIVVGMGEEAVRAGERDLDKTPTLDSTVNDRLPGKPAEPGQNRAQDADALPPEDGEAERLRAIAERLHELGARSRTLQDGTLVAIFEAADIITQRTAIDQAAHAARCALYLGSVLPGTAIAMATGRATVGKQRLLGDVIDQASRLLLDTGVVAPGIYINDTTMELLAARFEIVTRPDGPILLVTERVAASSPVSLAAVGPLVGRNRELDLLVSCLEASIEERRACVVQITGQPGFGKSRLVSELLQVVFQPDPLAEHSLASSDVAMWIGHGDPIRAGSSLEMMSQLLRSAAGLARGDEPAEQCEALRRWVADRVPDDRSDRIAMFLAEMLKIPRPDHDDVQLRAARMEPVLMGDQIRRACAELFDAESSRHPLILVLEDLHWSDAATVQLVDVLLRDLAERPFMVIAVSRPEIHDVFPRLWASHDATEVRLGRLTSRAAEELVRAVAGDELTSDHVARIVSQADGNAFCLHELARNAATAELRLPTTVLAMVQARLGALDPHARQILRAASLFGVRFWRDGVAAVLGMTVSLDEWLAALVHGQLITVSPTAKFQDQAEYVFRHALIREGAYEMLTEEDRLLGHRLAGEWLDMVGEPDEHVLAEQFARGGDLAQALPHYVRAAEDALGRHDFAAALSLVERAITCGARGSMLGTLQHVLIKEHVWSQRTVEITRLSAEAMELLPRGGAAWYAVLGEAALAWGKLGDSARVEELAEILRSTTSPADDERGRQIATAKLIVTFFLFLGQVERAEGLLGELEEQVGALAGADPGVVAEIHFARALRAEARGDPVIELAEFELCAHRYEEIGDLRSACLHRANAAYAKLEVGLDRAAESDLRAVMETATRMSIELAKSTAIQTLAQILTRRGDLDNAEKLARKAVERVEGREAHLAGWARIDLGNILLLAGDLAGAAGELDEALRLLAGTAPLRPLALARRAQVHLAEGEIALACQVTGEAMALVADAPTFTSSHAVVRLVHAEALRAAGKKQEAAAVLAEARAHLLARAEGISRADWRECFLASIPEHARTLELAGTTADTHS